MSLDDRLNEYMSGRYELAVVENTMDELIAGQPLKVRLINHGYKDRWFADPFVLDVTDSDFELLVEEYYYPEKKGRIAWLRVDRQSLSIVENRTVLNIDTHLSFPLIRRAGDEVFVIPENGQSGKLVTYRFDRDKQQLIPEKNLIEMPLADAVDVDVEDENFLFCTVCPDHSGSKLTIFKKSEDVYEPFQEYEFGSDKIARMAGDFFTYNGKLYRPCQDCNHSYGYGFMIQEVRKKGDLFDFITLSRYTSPLRRWKLGLHTLNSYKGVTITDVLGYTNPPALVMACAYTRAAIRRIKKFCGRK